MIAPEIRAALCELDDVAPGSGGLQLVRWAASPWLVQWALGRLPGLGIEAAEILSAPAALWAALLPSDRDRLRVLFASLESSAVVEYQIERNGAPRWVRESVRCVPTQRHGTALVSVLRDLTLERALTGSDRLPSAGIPHPPVQGRLVLVVEDDPHVRAIIGRILTRKGYGVLQAASAAEALRLWERAPTTVEVLVADVILPDRPGPMLARTLERRGADLRTIYVSGYSAEDLCLRAQLPPDAPFLAKPFRADELGALVDQMMARAAGVGGVNEGPRSAI